jgi:hypothetical protein
MRSRAHVGLENMSSESVFFRRIRAFEVPSSWTHSFMMFHHLCYLCGNLGGEVRSDAFFPEAG